MACMICATCLPEAGMYCSGPVWVGFRSGARLDAFVPSHFELLSFPSDTLWSVPYFCRAMQPDVRRKYAILNCRGVLTLVGTRNITGILFDADPVRSKLSSASARPEPCFWRSVSHYASSFQYHSMFLVPFWSSASRILPRQILDAEDLALPPL